MTKYFATLLLTAFFASTPSQAEPIQLVPDRAPFFQCSEESLAFLGEALGNQFKYKGDRKVLEVQTFFFSEFVYTAIRLAALPPNYFEETWLVKSNRASGKCVSVEATINAGDDSSGGGGVSVHN